MTILLIAFIAQSASTTGAVGGAVAGGSSAVGLTTWLVRRYIRRRDHQEDQMHQKLDALINQNHTMGIQLTGIDVQVKNNIQRLDRIDAGLDDVRVDMKTIKRRATDKQ